MLLLWIASVATSQRRNFIRLCIGLVVFKEHSGFAYDPVLALTLTKTNETTFTKALSDYEKKWQHFLEEKTVVLGINRPQYTHKNVRSALRSLKSNLHNLFTYQRYPELNIPNTTNSIDGYFASVKKKTAAHHGLRHDRRFRVISELLTSDGE